MKAFLPRRYQANIAHCAGAEVQKTSPFVMGPTGKLVSKTIRTERLRLERETPARSGQVDEYLGDGKNIRDEKWTKSIAVGKRSFVERIKSIMGVLAIGRKSIEVGESYQLREPSIPYGARFGAKKCYIGPENAYFWDVIL